MVLKIVFFVLFATFVLGVSQALSLDGADDQGLSEEVELPGTGPSGETSSDQESMEERGIEAPSGPSDAELQDERQQQRWLPQEQRRGLGIPQSGTGGGYPDPSMRTGTFGFDTSVPGAGGTRAGR